MSKNLPVIIITILCFFTACRKTIITDKENVSPVTISSQQLLLACGVREDPSRTAAALKTTVPSPTPVVLLLDFNGQQVQNTAWNTNGAINCPAVPGSLLTTSMIDYVFQSVTEDFSGFFVKVTKSEADYQAAPAARRMRCIVTYNMMAQFGNVGGVSIISSMLWGDNTPCFIFCDVLQYNQKYIAGAVAHELGHTFGLQHQSRYSTACLMEEEYHTGFGSEALSWAPIMGLSYYKSLVTWHNGPSGLGCDQMQNDMEIIRTVTGPKADDYSASLNSNTIELPSSGTKNGILENAGDNDAFLKKETNSRRIKVTSNGNSDIALEVYNSNGQFVTVYDDPASTNINVVISGKKYVKVKTSSNQPFVPGGDSFGGYSINVSAP